MDASALRYLDHQRWGPDVIWYDLIRPVQLGNGLPSDLAGDEAQLRVGHEVLRAEVDACPGHVVKGVSDLRL